MANGSTLHRMAAYMAWANDVVLRTAERLPPTRLTEPRDTLFGDIRGTFDHILVVAEMFEAHLEGRQHPHTSRRRAAPLPFTEVAARLRAMDARMVERAKSWTEDTLAECVAFEFVDGETGEMSREDILLHLVNHATYHRGFISVLLHQIKADGGSNDLTVFLRDAWPGAGADGTE